MAYSLVCPSAAWQPTALFWLSLCFLFSSFVPEGLSGWDSLSSQSSHQRGQLQLPKITGLGEGQTPRECYHCVLLPLCSVTQLPADQGQASQRASSPKWHLNFPILLSNSEGHKVPGRCQSESHYTLLLPYGSRGIAPRLTLFFFIYWFSRSQVHIT